MLDPPTSFQNIAATWMAELGRRIRMLHQINLAYFEYEPAELIGIGTEPEKRSLSDLHRWHKPIAESDFALMRYAQMHPDLREDATRDRLEIRGNAQE